MGDNIDNKLFNYNNSTFTQCSINNPLLITIEDINKLITSLNSFYQNTESLYNRTVTLINSFHILLNLFHEYTSDNQVINCTKNSRFLSEYARLNSLTTLCSNESIKIKSLKQENKAMLDNYSYYTQLNKELLLKYQNDEPSSSLMDLLGLIKKIILVNANIREQLDSKSGVVSVDNHYKKEEEDEEHGMNDFKENILLQKINELKEQNELLTVELFKKLSHDKEKEKIKERERSKYDIAQYHTKDNSNRSKSVHHYNAMKMQKELNSSMQSLKSFGNEIKQLEKANSKLTKRNQMITKKVTTFMSDSEDIINKVYQLLHKSNTDLQNLSKQYYTDMNYMKNLYNKKRPAPSLLKPKRPSFKQLTIKTNEINIFIEEHHPNIIYTILTQLTDIINGNYSLNSLNRQYDPLSKPKTPTINEIFIHIESIALLISYQKKKIDSQSKAIDYLTCDLNQDINQLNKMYSNPLPSQSHLSMRNLPKCNQINHCSSHNKKHSQYNNPDDHSFLFTPLSCTHKTKPQQGKNHKDKRHNSMIRGTLNQLANNTTSEDFYNGNKSFVLDNNDLFQNSEMKMRKKIEELKTKRRNEIKENILSCNRIDNNKDTIIDNHLTINDIKGNLIEAYSHRQKALSKNDTMNKECNNTHDYKSKNVYNISRDNNYNNKEYEPHKIDQSLHNSSSMKSINKTNYSQSVITQYHFSHAGTSFKQ